MKKLLLGLLLLSAVVSYSQNPQIEVGTTTDGKGTLSLLVKQQNGIMLTGAGIHGKASFIQSGVEIKNRFQVIGGMGIEESKNNIKGNNEAYFFIKANILLNKNFIIGFGIDNQNRGLYSIGYKLNIE